MSESTKLVRVTLAGFIRMEYVEVLRVPSDISDDELAQLAGKRYSDVDGGSFTQDPDYWERGECRATIVEGDPHLTATGCLHRKDGGDLQYAEAAPNAELPGGVALAAIEDNAAQARSLGLPKLNPYASSEGVADSPESKAFEAGWYRDFAAWCADVNRIEQERCDVLNATPGRLFRAAHTPYPPEMLRLYFDAGHTAQAANEIIVGNQDSGDAEASAS